MSLGVFLLVIIAPLVGLLGCSKQKDESHAESKSDSALHSQASGQSTAQGMSGLGDTRQKDHTVAENEICRRGDKYVAIRDVYQHPGAWIAFKIETNLAAPFDFAQNPEAYAYCCPRRKGIFKDYSVWSNDICTQRPVT